MRSVDEGGLKDQALRPSSPLKKERIVISDRAQR